MMIKARMIRVTIILTAMFMSILHVAAIDNNNGLTAENLLPQFANLTPEAASLGKYGAYHVSEYSGAANISIPLYEVKSGDVSFPISLYYDASGIKVEQDATFVGLGWNLSYGGMISRIVCGHDDFQGERGSRIGYWKDYWERSKSFPKDQPCQNIWQIVVNYVGVGKDFSPKDERESWLYGNMSKGYDTPDVFQASFCGHRLSFIIDPRAGTGADGQDSLIILEDDSKKYKISYIMANYGGNMYPSSFTIIDDKGIAYVFSPYTENGFSNLQVDSYYLTKIYGPDGINGKSVVTFEYEQPNYFHFGVGSRPYCKPHKSTARRIFNNTDEIPNTENFSSIFYSILDGFMSYPTIDCSEDGSCNKVYPKKITTALDIIEFKRGTRTDIKGLSSIEGITIKSIDSSTLRNISFAHGYFDEDNPKSDYSGKRLKLTGLTIDDQNYKFEYDNQKIPAYTSFSKDYWGYYNGANPNASRFVGCSPAYTISDGLVKPVEHLDGSNRLASETLCNVGMLRRVVYPTGGYTDYEYEIHRFNDKYYYPDAADLPVFTANNTATPKTEDENGGYSIGGGLRIKTIKNYDPDGQYLQGVEYKYSGGKLLRPTVQLEKHFIEFRYKNPAGLGNDDRCPNVSFYYANTEPSYPYICSLGISGTVGYDTVTKNEIDANGNVLRKTVLDFYNYGYITNDGNTNSINLRMQNSFYFNSYYNNNSGYAQGHLNGKIKKETISSGVGTPIYVANYTYTCEKQGSVLYPKCIPTHLSGFMLDAEKYDLAFFRKFITWSYLSSKSETFYNSSGSVVSNNTTTYTYNPSNYQPSTKTVSNGHQSEKTRYWYPLDAGNPSSGLSFLTDKNCLSEVTGIDIYRNNTYTTGSRYNYVLINSMPVVNSCLSIFPNGSTVREMEVNCYDDSGNIQQYKKKNGTPVTIIWSYRYQLPVMEIVGKTYSQVLSVASAVSQLGNMQSPSYSTIKTLYEQICQGCPDAHVTAYLYSPWHTVSRVIMPNGQELSYDYDGEGRLIRSSDLIGTLQEYQYKYKNQ